jgi:hypothetical protein
VDIFVIFKGVERSFSTMSRICNKLRQRLTPAHLDQLMIISLEGCENLTHDQLKEIVYHWYQKCPRRIQLPDWHGNNNQGQGGSE